LSVRFGLRIEVYIVAGVSNIRPFQLFWRKQTTQLTCPNRISGFETIWTTIATRRRRHVCLLAG